jgi:cytochrome P450
MLFDPAFLEDPYPRYAQWRDKQPIWYDEDNGSWVLSRYEDVRRVFKEHETFSSRDQSKTNLQQLPLLHDDPPRHTKLRALVNRAFTTRALKQMEERVTLLADDLVAAMPAGEPVDVAQQLTIPLPVAVIADLMNIPVERSADFKHWSDALTATAEMTLEERMAGIAAMADYFRSLLPSRRDNPGEDLISRLVTAEVDGAQLGDDEVTGFCQLLLIAGNETTTNLLSNFLNYCADHPETWQQLREDRSLVDAAVEETLRYDSPVQYVERRVLADTEFHGQPVKAGERVTILMGSANRDEREYEGASDFRLDRGRSNHHTFGHGIHFCIGAPLGRMEAQYAVEALLRRFGRIAPAPRDPLRTNSFMLRGFHHLWLQFE